MGENRYSSIPIDEAFFEQAIIDHLQDMGYEHLFGPDVVRTTSEYRDAFLPEVLPESLRRINPGIPDEAITEAVLKINTIESGSLAYRNETFSDYLQSGVEVTFFNGVEEQTDIVSLLDFENIESNSFHAVNQWTYVELEEKRPDVIIFINGLPLVIFELKSPSRENVNASDAYLQLRNYMNTIPTLFVYNTFCVMSDMADTRVGTITAKEDRYMRWKTVDGNYSETSFADWRTMLDGMCEKGRLLDIIRNFICFSNDAENSAKILAGYHQYFAVKKAIGRTESAMESDGKAGVFWHTQGSGKSLSMVFFAHLLQQRLDSPTIVVITDRNDLDDQLYQQFVDCKSFLRQTPQQASSQDNLVELLAQREANGIVFSTMQKFTDSNEALSERSDIIVMVDEAHRGQYGLTEVMHKDGTVTVGEARIIRKALPHATYIGFTGTPIETEDKNTREIFGDYIDIYDMTQSVEDEATRPVYYESRVVALKLDENVLAQIDSEYEAIADNADELAIERSKQELARLDGILGAPETINDLCTDIVDHYENTRADELTGKALIVAYSRPIAMKIYEKILALRPSWTEKIGVVMTSGNQDPEEWKSIIGTKSHKIDMARKFKDDKNPLKIAIVVDMWLTGFDVPSLATMYIYKPMKGHNLMQAIARVNRVYKGKEGGLVVDYIGIASALKRAMRDYTARDRDRYGDMDIGKTAYPRFLEKLDVCRDFLHGFNYRGRIKTKESQELAAAIADGLNFLLAPARADSRNDFIAQAKLMNQALSLCKSLVSEELIHEAAFIGVLRAQLIKLSSTGDGPRLSLNEINKRISAILEQSVHSEGVINLFEEKGVELSLFDESFLEEVSKMKQKNLAFEMLKRLIEDQVRTYKGKSVVKAQKFSDMLQRSVNSYLNGMLTNAEVMEELLKMAHEMMQERNEGVAMGLSDEELAFYDALTKPQAVKDFYQNDELIAITKELTDTLRKNRTIDWQKKEGARARMRLEIKRLLKKHKYPPDEAAGALEIVMEQCELWADTMPVA